MKKLKVAIILTLAAAIAIGMSACDLGGLFGGTATEPPEPEDPPAVGTPSPPPAQQPPVTAVPPIATLPEYETAVHLPGTVPPQYETAVPPIATLPEYETAVTLPGDVQPIPPIITPYEPGYQQAMTLPATIS